MDYKKMIMDYAKNGGDEKKMWASVDVTEMAMEYIKEHAPEKYECLMRKLHEALYGKHYCEEFALHDVAQMHSTGADGAKHVGAHWTVDQIEAATKGLAFPAGTTKWDKYVAFNAFANDLGGVLTDELVLKAAYAFWFDDEDWSGEGKIWDYMSK